MSKLKSLLVVSAMLLPATVQAAGTTRPGVASYSAPVAAGQLRGGSRAGARVGSESKMDSGDDIILIGAALVGGYFLHDVIKDDDHHDSKSPD